MKHASTVYQFHSIEIWSGRWSAEVGGCGDRWSLRGSDDVEGGQTLQAASVEAEPVEFEDPMSMPDMSMMATACEGRATRRLSGREMVGGREEAR